MARYSMTRGRRTQAASGARVLSLPLSQDGLRLGVYRYGADHRARDATHSHSFFELMYVEEGKGIHWMGQQEVPAEAGHVALIAPGVVHDVGKIQGAMIWIVAFAADAIAPGQSDASILLASSHGLLKSFLGARGFEARHFRVPQPLRARWTGRLWDLRNELESRAEGYTVAARALLELLLLDVVRLDAVAPLQPEAPPHRVLEEVFRFIEQRYRSPIGLSDVARTVGLSSAYLTDLVRRETGRTVLQWIIERRLAEARKLLLQDDRPLSAVAESVGYDSVRHFIRQFRQFQGVTPHLWRRMARGTATPRLE